ncbi:MAG: hypothetical protein AAF280_04955 [Pseudomonadota bacterium]
MVPGLALKFTYERIEREQLSPDYVDSGSTNVTLFPPNTQDRAILNTFILNASDQISPNWTIDGSVSHAVGKHVIFLNPVGCLDLTQDFETVRAELRANYEGGGFLRRLTFGVNNDETDEMIVNKPSLFNVNGVGKLITQSVVAKNPVCPVRQVFSSNLADPFRKMTTTSPWACSRCRLIRTSPGCLKIRCRKRPMSTLALEWIIKSMTGPACPPMPVTSVSANPYSGNGGASCILVDLQATHLMPLKCGQDFELTGRVTNVFDELVRVSVDPTFTDILGQPRTISMARMIGF